jgi:nucleoid DNA-binding protein
MLTKSELIGRIADKGAGGRQQVKHVLDALAEVAEEEVAAGNDITIPGVVRVSWKYTSPLKKGEKYKKGETYVGFGGVEQEAEADSKARKESVKLKAAPTGAINKAGKVTAAQRKAIRAKRK